MDVNDVKDQGIATTVLRGVLMAIGILGVGLLIAAVIILPPVVFVWCINTIFSMVIPMTLKNWFAVWVLMAVTSSPAMFSAKVSKSG